MFEFPRKHLLSYQVGIFSFLPRDFPGAKAIWLSLCLVGVGVINYFCMLVHVRKQTLIGGFGHVLFHIYIYLIYLFHICMNINVYIFMFTACANAYINVCVYI